MMNRYNFDPDNISKEDMNNIADNIENYIELLKDVMIIPESISKKHEKRIQKALKITEKLIKKLRKGDTSVFKDREDWDLF